MKLRTTGEIRLQPIGEPTKINVVISRSDLQRLKMAAIEHNTTVNEIFRALATDFLEGKISIDDKPE